VSDTKNNTRNAAQGGRPKMENYCVDLRIVCNKSVQYHPAKFLGRTMEVAANGPPTPGTRGVTKAGLPTTFVNGSAEEVSMEFTH